ncbi:hypothetical protein GCM10011383_33010 [Hymenobacter cavernae]|uniref:Cyanobacterial TRADD-N associated 2 transmembrane domain-containing protein n=2 Tax=Hymenobacter cavernae TaxID=2044852 RepID=A0ABQ1UII3_9BACT|nr:hypothetical protein GCM10011383_33010 [Hymenobacter cavernae]
MYFDRINSGYKAIIAGIISEFISAVFFYLYNKTIMQMSKYHSKLVITQNISLALKISESMPEQEKIKVQSLITRQLTRGINQYLASDSNE